METRASNLTGSMNVSASGPNICRICLTKGNSTITDGRSRGGMLESIFATVSDYEDKSFYGLLLSICSPLGQREMLTGMPERICRTCKWRLLSAYELYETCLRSDEKMRKLASMKNQQQQQQQQQQPAEETTPGVPPIQVKQEPVDREEYGQNVTAEIEEPNSLLTESTFLPVSESSHLFDSTNDLLEEMTPAVDPNETLFEENYKLTDKGEHSCAICKQEFPYKSQARSHIIVKHDPTKPFKCDVCLFTFTTQMRMLRHKSCTHGVEEVTPEEIVPDAGKEADEEPTYTCKICTKVFTSAVRFKIHKGVHVVYNRPFKCETCLYRFPNRAQFTQHLKTHKEKPANGESTGDGEWKCEYCEEKFAGKRALTMHTRRSHPQETQNESREKGEYKCIICSEEFARESVLNTHMKMHELLAFEKEKGHRQELEYLVKKELKAQLPAKSISSFNTSTDLNNASSSSIGASPKKRSDADAAFVCMVCEEEFEERGELLKHQKRLHTELQLNIVSNAAETPTKAAKPDNVPQVSPVKSPTPTKSVKQPEMPQEDPLKDAEPMVVDVDPTELLAQAPSDVDSLKRPEAIPKCDLCQKTFMYNCLLQTHMKNSHSETKPFECKVCKMRFGYRGTLQKHELTHSAQNIRPGEHGSIMYKCKICFAKFLELKALTSHLRMHRSLSMAEPPRAMRKVEIYKCFHCPQIFNSKDNFDEHIIKEHRRGGTQKQQQQSQPNPHSRKNPDPRRVVERKPMSEKELFFDSLSIVKVEHS